MGGLKGYHSSEEQKREKKGPATRRFGLALAVEERSGGRVHGKTRNYCAIVGYTFEEKATMPGRGEAEKDALRRGLN